MPKNYLYSQRGILEIECKRIAARAGMTLSETGHKCPALYLVKPNSFVYFGEKLNPAGMKHIATYESYHYFHINSTEQFEQVLNEILNL